MMLREAKLVRYPFGNYWWQEVNPHEYQIRRADPGQTIIGRLVEVPAHGRDKGKWVLPDANQEYPVSETAVMGLELWHKWDTETAPIVPPSPPEPPTPITASEPEPASEPAPPPPIAPPEVDTTGYLGANAAAVAYGMSRGTFLDRLQHDEIPGAVKVPHGNRAGFRYLVPPPVPAPMEVPAPEPPPEPPPAPVAPAPQATGEGTDQDWYRQFVDLRNAHQTDMRDLARDLGRLLTRLETVEYELAQLRHAPAPVPHTAPSFWQRLTGTPTNGRTEGKAQP